MKLFLWAEPYPVNYGSSLYFAVADTVEQAREIAAIAKWFSYGTYDQHQDPAPTAPELLKNNPTRVLDLPCGEWHRWEE